MGYILDSSRRFFHPACIDEMLETFLPYMNGTNLNVSPNLRLNLRIAHGLTLFVTVCLSYGILLAVVLASVTSTVVSTDALPLMGISELVQF